MHDTTAIIISFLRPAYTVGAIESLRATYPDIKIIVGENGNDEPSVREACDRAGAEYVKLPFDSGVCVGRNTLMKLVETEFVLVGDDDFFYDENARVNSMAAFLRTHEEYDLIGGRILEGGIVKNYQGHLVRAGKRLIERPIEVDKTDFRLFPKVGDQEELRYCQADLVFNFFVARADKVREIPWDEQIKVAYEHESWFLDAQKKGLRVAFTPDAIVVHKARHLRDLVEASSTFHEYAAYRNRRGDKERFFKSQGINHLVDMNGTHDYAPDHVAVKRSNDVKHVDFCITTFLRPHALERLLFSIAEFYPGANVYVADQNEHFDREFYKDLRWRLWEAGLAKRIQVDWLGYDVGLSAGRNFLVEKSPNRYKLILDDDMVFTEKTDIGQMVRLMDAFPAAGVVGGLVTQNGQEVHYEFQLEIQGDTIMQIQDRTPMRELHGAGRMTRYRKTGCVLNFALFRKEVFDYIKWDPDLKVTEHTDFYLRWKNMGKRFEIVYTPDAVIDHPPVPKTAQYKEMRQRPEFLALMFRKHGVRRVKYLNGTVHELEPNGAITRYKENPA